MKKLTGWLLIIFCSMFLLIFAIALFGITTNFSAIINMPNKDILTSLLGFLIVIPLFIFGIISGIKKVKKENVIEIIQFNRALNIKLSGQIKYIDYRNLILGISFKKPIYILVAGIMLLFLLTLLVNFESIINNFDSNFYMFIFLGVFIFSPVLTIIKIKKLYNTNKIFHEQLNYCLTNDSIQIKGDTVESIQKWSHFYQIRETKIFFMFYQGEMTATLIDKSMFSESELQEFKDFIKSLKAKRV